MARRKIIFSQWYQKTAMKLKDWKSLNSRKQVKNHVEEWARKWGTWDFTLIEFSALARKERF